MKKLLIFVYALSLSLLLSSCGDEPYDISDGGVAYANISGPATGVYLTDETVTVSADINIDVATGQSLSGTSAKIQLIITAADKTVTSSDLVNIADITASTSEVRTFSFDHTALFTNLPVEGVVWDDTQLKALLAVGGLAKWVISFDGGSVGGINPDFVFDHTVNVICASNIPTAGTWTGSNTVGAFSNFTTQGGVSVSTGSSPGDYSMSDISSGFFLPFGPTWMLQPAVINDFCGQISIKEAPDAQVNIATSPAFGPGSWDPATETLTVNWYDATNDFDEISVYTRE